MRKIRGTLTRGFHRDNFVITTLDGNDESWRVKGEMEHPCWGETYELLVDDEPEVHPRHGAQWRFYSARLIVKRTAAGVYRFLVDGPINGVGKVLADRLVDHYGESALDVLTDNPELVAEEIDGISSAKALAICDQIRQQTTLIDTWVELESLLGGDPDTKRAVKSLIDTFGIEATQVLKQDPYQATLGHGIGFRTADLLAKSLGVGRDSPSRREAAIRHVLSDVAKTQGSTVMVVVDVASAAEGIAPGSVITPGHVRETHGVVCIGSHAQLARYARAEAIVAGCVADLRGPCDTPLDPAAYANLDPERHDDQIRALQMFERERLMLLTGPPGTGKTHAVDLIVNHCGIDPDTIGLAAPYGKAAKRLAEATGLYHARTMHSLLGVQGGGLWKFAHDREHPLPHKLIVCDELGTLEMLFSGSFFQAIAPGCRVLLIGDEYQLPSVGAGNVLRDFVAAGLPHARLTKIKRNTGDLMLAIHAVKDGRRPLFSQTLDPDSGQNCRWINTTQDKNAATILTLIDRMRDRGFDPRHDIQVISPVNDKEPLGCRQLNRIIGDHVRGYESDRLEVGDKCIQIRRNRVLRNKLDGERCWVVNGDVGEVLHNTGSLVVRHQAPDREIEYSLNDPNVVPAWAMTVHRCQGSGFPVVIMPVDASFAGPLWTRNLVYTAMSRAEQILLGVGDQLLVNRALGRVITDERRTALTQRIIEREVELMQI